MQPPHLPLVHTTSHTPTHKPTQQLLQLPARHSSQPSATALAHPFAHALAYALAHTLAHAHAAALAATLIADLIANLAAVPASTLEGALAAALTSLSAAVACILLPQQVFMSKHAEASLEVFSNLQDQYYDLSSARWDHLEMPRQFDYMEAGNSFVEKCRYKILVGDPLAREAVSTEQGPTTQRGGCMVLFRKSFGLLRLEQTAPQVWIRIWQIHLCVTVVSCACYACLLFFLICMGPLYRPRAQTDRCPFFASGAACVRKICGLTPFRFLLGSDALPCTR